MLGYRMNTHKNKMNEKITDDNNVNAEKEEIEIESDQEKLR